jgi:hypothetical protein
LPDEAVLIFDRHAEPLHNGTRVFAKALLAGNQRITVMGILHRTLFQVARHSNVMVWSQDQAGSSASKEFPKSLDFVGSGLLLRKHMVESEYHHRVRVFQYAFVKGLSLPRLVDTLIDRDRMSGNLTDELLESQEGEVKQL